MRISALVLMLLALAPLVFAQSAPPALVVNDQGKPELLTISRVDIGVRILGHIAETSMTITFSNSKNRQLEGDLLFPLPEGATVCGYAIDLEGRMVDGVVVEHRYGREAYERIVRRQIDPGLLEWVKGNTFRARVFPIPAEGCRTVAVRYVTDLVDSEGGSAYRLPLNFKTPVGVFHLRVEAVKAVSSPKVIRGGLGNFAFSRVQDAYVAETTQENVALTDDLAVVLADPQKPRIEVETSPDGRTYFCIHDLAMSWTAREVAPPAPKRITILWDGSGSRARSDHARELNLLEAYFAELQGSAVEVDLVVFRNKVGAPQRFTVRDGDARSLLAALRAVEYDGGTQIGDLAPPPGAEAPDFYLLFTDGISTFGREEPGRFGAPVYIFSAAEAVNDSFFKQMVLGNGGAYFDLDRLGNEEVLRYVGRLIERLLGVEVAEGKVSDLCVAYPERGIGSLRIAGRLESETATLTLKYGWGSDVKRRNPVRISAKDAAQGTLLRYVWAQTKVAELLNAPRPDEAAIVHLATAHGIVTPYTSLIVLESLEQYLEFKIRPAETLPEIRKAYDEAMAAHEEQDEQPAEEVPPKFEWSEETAHLEHLVALWKYRIGCWQEECEYPKGFRYRPSAGDRGPMGGIAAPLGAWYGVSEAAGAGGGFGGLFGGGGPRFELGAVTPWSGYPVRDLVADVPTFGGAAVRGGEVRGPEAVAPTADEKGDTGDVETLQVEGPARPYLDALEAAGPEKVWAVYLAERRKHAASPEFFLDCADFFARRGESDRAVQGLSNIAELEMVGMLRVAAYRFLAINRLDLAAAAFEEVRRAWPDDRRADRDLARVLAQQGEYERAVELLYRTVMDTQDDSDSIAIPALVELNRLIPHVDRAVLERIGIDRRLIKRLDADIRVVVSWDADVADIDLWVTEPSGEKCFTGRSATTIGGQLWRDIEWGGGPEEYILRKAMPGVYTIQVHLASDYGPTLTGDVMVCVDLFTDYGRPNERHRSVVVRLREAGKAILAGEIEF